MKTYHKCPYCGSEFVTWNWIHTPFWRTWPINLIRRAPASYKRPWEYLRQWGHECWNCDRISHTFLKVRNGKPYDEVRKGFQHLPIHNLNNIRGHLGWMVSQCKYFTETTHDLRVWEKRRQLIHKLVDETIDGQWKIDHPECKDENAPYTPEELRKVGMLPKKFYDWVLGTSHETKGEES